jgi:hypothetical protein
MVLTPDVGTVTTSEEYVQNFTSKEYVENFKSKEFVENFKSEEYVENFTAGQQSTFSQSPSGPSTSQRTYSNVLDLSSKRGAQTLSISGYESVNDVEEAPIVRTMSMMQPIMRKNVGTLEHATKQKL